MNTTPRAFRKPFGVLFILVTAMSLLGAAQNKAEPTPPATTKAKADAKAAPQLAFSIYFQSGMVQPENDHTGVLLAAWDDGLVVYAESDRKPMEPLKVGRLTPEQIRTVLDELHAARFFEDLPGGGVAPDASYTIIRATREQKACRYWCM